MDTGEILTRWTARLAMLLYATAIALWLTSERDARSGWTRRLWTTGCAVYVLHVAAAFHYYHHWSHAEAYCHTAEATLATIRWYWGGGLYFNYAFTLVWLADVGWWWTKPATYLARPRLLTWAIHAFLAFMVFNATVVFGIGPIRWWGVGGTVLLAILVVRRFQK